MRGFFSLLIIIFILISCNENDNDIINEKFIFNYNIHESLPSEWFSEFYTIMNNFKLNHLFV